MSKILPARSAERLFTPAELRSFHLNSHAFFRDVTACAETIACGFMRPQTTHGACTFPSVCRPRSLYASTFSTIAHEKDQFKNNHKPSFEHNHGSIPQSNAF